MNGISKRKAYQPTATRRIDIASGRVICDETQAKPDSASHVDVNRTRALLLSAAFLLIAGVVLLSGCAMQTAGQANAAPIEIESLRVTAAGHYLDLRYRVLDAKRANASLGPGVKPVLTDQATGIVMDVPMTAKLGALRQTRGDQRPNRSYFVLFNNSAGLTPGSRVKAELGDIVIDNIVVQ